jgi:hypothetical protein
MVKLIKKNIGFSVWCAMVLALAVVVGTKKTCAAPALEIPLTPYYAVGYDYGGGAMVYFPELWVDSYAKLKGSVSFNYDGTYDIINLENASFSVNANTAKFSSGLNVLYVPLLALGGKYYAVKVWLLKNQHYTASITELQCAGDGIPQNCQRL